MVEPRAAATVDAAGPDRGIERAVGALPTQMPARRIPQPSLSRGSSTAST
jgi:hypothetical protein